MDISITTNPSKRADYMKAQANPAQAEKKTSIPAPARTQDEVEIFSDVQKALVAQGTDTASSVGSVSEEQTDSSKATTFTTFAEEFSKITQSYANTIREYYAADHEENMPWPLLVVCRLPRLLTKTQCRRLWRR